jgi:hypothetical protein
MAEAPGPGNSDQSGRDQERSPSRGLRWPKLLRTWPRRLGALLLPPLVGWAVAYFVPGIWSGLTGKEPLEVGVLTDLTTFQSKLVHTGGFVIPKPSSQLDDPRSTDLPELFAWAHSQGGVDAYKTLIRIVVRGSSSSPVVLQSLQVKVLDRKLPTRGTLVLFRPVAGGLPVRHVSVDLDQDPPAVQVTGGRGFPLWVSDGEVEVFDVIAATSKCHCLWEATLHYTAGGESGSITIDKDGEPFETTIPAQANEPYYCLEARMCRLTPAG